MRRSQESMNLAVLLAQTLSNKIAVPQVRATGREAGLSDAIGTFRDVCPMYEPRNITPAHPTAKRRSRHQK